MNQNDYDYNFHFHMPIEDLSEHKINVDRIYIDLYSIQFLYDVEIKIFDVDYLFDVFAVIEKEEL